MLRVSVLLTLALAVVAAPSPRAAQVCTDVTVIFARGTGEVAPLGTIVGPPLLAALQADLVGRSLAFIGVDYAASVAGFLAGGDPIGAQTMANDVAVAAAACPNTEIVMSGYRYGSVPFSRVAQVSHLLFLRIVVREPNLFTSLLRGFHLPFNKGSGPWSFSVTRIMGAPSLGD